MTTENRRKEEKEAKTKDSGRNLVPPSNSAMVDKAEREESVLPDNQRYIHIPKIEGVVGDYNIQEAIKAFARIYTFEAMFSENSYGFRPGRKAQQAILKAQEYIREGYEWVVDIDLEKFFDKVNHDILMSRVARKVKDKKILLLIRRFLQAGVMENGLVTEAEEGTPQGGPLSPLLSNIMLDDFDKELEKRRLRFTRYADDCNIYVKSEKAGQRVMESVVKFLTTKLKLKVNQQKSAVADPWERKFLGFTFKKKEPGKIVVHERRVKRLKDKIRGLTKKMRGNNLTDSIPKLIMPITRGWANYFGIAEERGIFESIDGWIRRKIRGIQWRQCKKPKARLKKLVALGIKRIRSPTYAGVRGRRSYDLLLLDKRHSQRRVQLAYINHVLRKVSNLIDHGCRMGVIRTFSTERSFELRTSISNVS